MEEFSVFPGARLPAGIRSNSSRVRRGTSPLGGHLARLAVRPDAQRKGIGTALVRDMLWQFERRGAERVTVNTQEDNQASLTLYQKAGFELTGESYPVFQYFLHPDRDGRSQNK